MSVDLYTLPYNKRGGYSTGDEALNVELYNYYGIFLTTVRSLHAHPGERHIIVRPDAFLVESFQKATV